MIKLTVYLCSHTGWSHLVVGEFLISVCKKNNDNIIVWNFLLNLKSIENSESLIIPQMRFINDENGTLKIKK